MDGSCKSSTAAPWMFSLAVRPGTRDLIATGQIGGMQTVAVSRNQAIAGTTSLPVIDLASGGMRLDRTPILVRNADTSSGVPTASATVTLTTRNGASDVSSRLDVLSTADAIVADTIPSAALEPGDSQARGALTQGYARLVGVRDDSTSVTYMTTQRSNVQAMP